MNDRYYNVKKIDNYNLNGRYYKLNNFYRSFTDKIYVKGSTKEDYHFKGDHEIYFVSNVQQLNIPRLTKVKYE